MPITFIGGFVFHLFWETELAKGMKRKLIMCITAVIVICALSYTDPFAKMFARNENTRAFNTYTQETVNELDALPGN